MTHETPPQPEPGLLDAALDAEWEALATDIHANGYSVRDAIAAHRPAIQKATILSVKFARLPVSGESEGLRERLAEIVSDALAAATEGTDYAEAPVPSDEPGSPYVMRLTDEMLPRVAALTRSSEARTDGPESVSPGGDVPQSDGPVVDEPAATDSDPLERARVLIETIAAASAELATLYGPLWHLTRSSEARTEPEAEGGA